MTKGRTRLIPAVKVPEGAGVTVQRTIGTPSLRNYDPFLLLDFFGSDNPDEYIAGFPSHPHRGFSTFTYMLDGHIEHQDSMGNSGDLRPGGAQLMKAASGIIHSEMPKQENGLLRGFQLWINLPAANKMDRPEYQEFQVDAFPVIETDDYTIKVIIGQFADVSAPIVDSLAEVTYLDITLAADRSFRHTLSALHNNFFFVFEGEVYCNEKQVPINTLVVLGDEDTDLGLRAGGEGARLVLVSGKPIGEPIAQYGPFVMNTREEIEQAMKDYQSNKLVRETARISSN